MNWFLAKIGSGNVGHISKLSGSFYADWLICWPKAMPRQLSCFFFNCYFSTSLAECYA